MARVKSKLSCKSFKLAIRGEFLPLYLLVGGAAHSRSVGEHRTDAREVLGSKSCWWDFASELWQLCLPHIIKLKLKDQSSAAIVISANIYFVTESLNIIKGH